MRRSRLLLGLAGLLLAVSVAAAILTATKRGHLHDSECGNCHLAGREVTAANARLLAADELTLCQPCHDNAVKLSHPSGFAARYRPPAELPLNWKGELTCNTCHQIHGSGAGLLRSGKKGREFCLLCHAPDFFTKMAVGGARMVLSGHEMADGAFLARDLDPASLACVRCHLAFTGKLRVYVDPNLVAIHGEDTSDHPLGRAYPAAPGFRPQARLDPRLQLPAGKLGCTSCHAAGGKVHGRLHLPIARQQRLCKECHVL